MQTVGYERGARREGGGEREVVRSSRASWAEVELSSSSTWNLVFK